MAMMGSSAWNGQEHHGLPQGSDEDFQQFLDMNSMNLPDSMPFDFSEFQTANGAHMLQSQPREHLDTPMSGTDTPGLLSRSEHGPHGQMHAVTTGPSHPTIPSSTMVSSSTASDAIVEIDAQIQFLQQQRLQEQQRQLEEQNAAFYARQSRMVPPTPQSLEIPSANQFYASQEQQSQQQAIFERFQHLKEQQDVSRRPSNPPGVKAHFPVERTRS